MKEDEFIFDTRSRVLKTIAGKINKLFPANEKLKIHNINVLWLFFEFKSECRYCVDGRLSLL